ncbi:hypothetical protein COK72_24950 [Bacillus thuringiensis]|uniref:Uncharacterized protein n=1 Tax=Bacillus thuringiensis TaxID=1428 RepID=A0A9X7AIZ5_BACTU|nr:hypothetical protein COK72_24950 [Bacillus thuringiensis]PQQ46656.1 hypothetical protein C6A34_14715 [Bacillus thuringiensis]
MVDIVAKLRENALLTEGISYFGIFYLKVYYRRKRLCRRFIPLFSDNKTPTSKFSESKEVRWGSGCQ